jgi:hypothetical protein
LVGLLEGVPDLLEVSVGVGVLDPVADNGVPVRVGVLVLIGLLLVGVLVALGVLERDAPGVAAT